MSTLTPAIGFPVTASDSLPCKNTESEFFAGVRTILALLGVAGASFLS